MCGIFALTNDPDQQAAQTILKGLQKLEYRGYDSWGIAVQTQDKKLEIEKHIGKISDATTTLPHASTAMGHTRWATHGGVTDQNAHPHADCHNQIAVVHNGIVENYQELKQALISKNHQFKSETDTEVIAHLIEELATSMDYKSAVFTAFKQLVGSNAIVAFNIQSGEIIACRDGSPLVCGVGEGQYFLASDVTAFVDKTKQVIFLKDRQAVSINDQLEVFDLDKNQVITPNIETVDWDLEEAQKDGYPHYMIKEIMQQAKTIANTASLNHDQFEMLIGQAKTFDNIVLTGCGTAYYCAFASTYFFAKHGIQAVAYPANEFEPFTQMITPKTLFIAISQSGETADTIIAVKAAKERGAKIAGIINAQGTSLSRLTDFNFQVGTGPEISVVSTKAYTAQLATVYQLAAAFAGKYQQANADVKALGKVLPEWMSQALQNQVLELSKKIVDSQDIYVIGKHLQFPAAYEFSLKLKETAYIHSEAFAAGELKHGVISLIQKGTPCIVIADNSHTKGEVLSSATELKARGAFIIGIAPFKAPEFDDHIETLDLGDLTILGNVIVGQLMGYYLGLGRGADPDKPRNLAKSVTVK